MNILENWIFMFNIFSYLLLLIAVLAVYSVKKCASDDVSFVQHTKTKGDRAGKQSKKNKVLSMIKKLVDEPLENGCKQLEIDYDFTGDTLRIKKSA